MNIIQSHVRVVQKNNNKCKFKKLRPRKPVSHITDDIILIIQKYEIRMCATYQLCNIAARSYYYRCLNNHVNMDPSWVLLLYQFAVLFFLPMCEHERYIGWKNIQQFIRVNKQHKFQSYFHFQIHILENGLDWMLCIL
jgi:hypothetical protein